MFSFSNNYSMGYVKRLLDYIYTDENIILQLTEVISVTAEYLELTNIIAS